MFREAKKEDVKGIIEIINSIKENKLPHLISINDKDLETMITANGKAWVYEINNSIAGFSIVDLNNNQLFLLKIKPELKGKGIRKELYTLLMDWYFDQTKTPIWIDTTKDPESEKFYEKLGWTKKDTTSKYEMTYKSWIQNG